MPRLNKSRKDDTQPHKKKINGYVTAQQSATSYSANRSDRKDGKALTDHGGKKTPGMLSYKHPPHSIPMCNDTTFSLIMAKSKKACTAVTD
jgi:hypothetical protein